MSSTTFDPEAYAAELAERWTGARPDECLYCYLGRVLGEFGCHGAHEWTKRWCDAQSMATGWVLRWGRRNGGCCCDCEVVMNVFRDDRRSKRHTQLRCAPSYSPEASGHQT